MIKKERGLYNSSITRVRPFIRNLLCEKESKDLWIKDLLEFFMKRNQEDELVNSYVKSLLNKNFTIINDLLTKRRFKDEILGYINLEKCFEYSIAPTYRFLEWLIRNPGELTWPNNGKQKYSEDTMYKRESIIGEHGRIEQSEIQELALKLLEEYKPIKSRRKWWAFEGFTQIDCFLETNDLVIAIEGKRTENISSSIEWFPKRNQVIRNLEVIKESAGSKDFVLILIYEETTKPIGEEDIINSLPHYNETERKELMKHYLGHISWKEACEVTKIDYSNLPSDRYQI